MLGTADQWEGLLITGWDIKLSMSGTDDHWWGQVFIVRDC